MFEAVAVKENGLENWPVRAQEHVPDGVWGIRETNHTELLMTTLSEQTRMTNLAA